tara:strand:- start:97 stop:378 length:282 start_codon:yes stop_codon:yes gene_type:complete
MKDKLKIKMTRKELFSIRSLTVWLVLWGNIIWLFNLLLIKQNIFSIKSFEDPRTIFISAVLAILASRWLLPKIFGNSILSRVNGTSQNRHLNC